MTAPDELSSFPAQTAPIRDTVSIGGTSNISGRDVAFIVGGTALLWMLAYAAAYAIVMADKVDLDDVLSPWFMVIVTFVCHGTMLAMTWLRMRGRWRTAADWHLAPFKPVYVIVGLPLGAAIIGMGILAPLPRPEFSLKVYLSNPSAGALVLGALAAFLAPFAEEVFFRGILCRWLSERINSVVGIAVSAMMFGIGHYDGSWWSVGYATATGIIFALVYQLQGSLLTVIVAHTLINCAYVMAVFEQWS